MRIVKQIKAVYVALSALFVLLGVCLLIWPDISAVTLCYVFGSVLILYGVAKLLGYFCEDPYRLAFQFDLAAGILTVVVGALFLLHPDNIIRMLPTVTGLFILLESVLKLQTAFDAKRFGMRRWWLILIASIAAAACGILLLVYPFESVLLLTRIMGIAIIVNGVENLWTALYTVRVRRREKKPSQGLTDETGWPDDFYGR